MIPLNLRTIYKRLLEHKHDWRIVSVTNICEGRTDILMGLYENNKLMHTSLVPVGFPELICFPEPHEYRKDTL